MKLAKPKVFRDPIHNYISINEKIIWDLINIKCFQRLNNLYQLGVTYQIFHGATHTRFGHSLGVYEITKHIIKKLQNSYFFVEEEKLALLCSALLHDIGHGPFSHSSELFLNLKHETITNKIILEDEEIDKILKSYSPTLKKKIIQIISRIYPKKSVYNIISGEVDADRMDYLLRDSYYTGVFYGYYDKERIIRVMETKKDNIVFKSSGFYVLENFMLSRYHMKKQVYNNTKSLAYERLLCLSVRRTKELYYKDKIKKNTIVEKFIAFLNFDTRSEIKDFIEYDDNLFMAMYHFFKDVSDEILSFLSNMILNRKLPKIYRLDKKSYNKLSIILKEEQLKDSISSYLFDIFCDKSEFIYNKYNGINILKNNNDIVDITEISPIVSSLNNNKILSEYYLFIIEDKFIEYNYSLYKNIKQILNEVDIYHGY